jgi:hypothetical protein
MACSRRETPLRNLCDNRGEQQPTADTAKKTKHLCQNLTSGPQVLTESGFLTRGSFVRYSNTATLSS